MAKYSGKVGYVSTDNSENEFVYSEKVIERPYKGDSMQLRSTNTTGNTINGDIRVSVRLSIVADPFAKNNLGRIKYATFNGIRWNVDSVEVQYPRIILNLGGVYNGATPI